MKNKIAGIISIVLFSFLLTGCGKDQIPPRINVFDFFKSEDSAGSIKLHYLLSIDEPNNESGIDRYEFKILAPDNQSVNLNDANASHILYTGGHIYSSPKYNIYEVEEFNLSDFNFPVRITEYRMMLVIWDREGNSRVSIRDVLL